MKQLQPQQRGRLKVFLSYAAGAGKTYRMLEEAQELKKRGEDIVIGYFEPHARPDGSLAHPSTVRYGLGRSFVGRSAACETA